MKLKTELTQARLRELLDYCPETGVFSRRVTTSPRALAGAVAGSVLKVGYRQIRVLGRKQYAHRLAWLYVRGEWPECQIDHINGDRSDNRIANLRSATNAENQQNTKLRDDNRSGSAGVSWSNRRKRWVASIVVGGVKKYICSTEDVAAAARAYSAAKAEFHAFNPEIRAGHL